MPSDSHCRSRTDRELLLEATHPLAIPHVTCLIHDCAFDLDALVFEEKTGQVTVPFELPREDLASVRRDLFVVRELSIPVVPALLAIKNVVDVIIDDTEAVGIYDFNELRWDEHRSELSITTGVPLRLCFKVSRLEIRLEADTSPTATVTRLTFGRRRQTGSVLAHVSTAGRKDCG